MARAARPTESPAASRRRLLAAGLGGALAGCGFALQRPVEIGFRTIQLTGFAPRSAMAAEFRRQLDATRETTVVETIKEAEAVLHALEESREKTSVAKTAANLVREFELRLKFRFELKSATGRELIGESEILLKRDLTYTESAALAKEQEEAFLYRAMQSDIVAQVLRRIAATTS